MRAKVLIIEDEPEISELISLYLSREGLEVLRREDGETGLAALDAENPDLLILDLNLPGMDGYEVLQSLRRAHELPVVIVSARTDDADMILGFGYGADDFVQKPFSPKVLAARVRAHLRRKARAGGEEDIAFGPFRLDPKAKYLRRGEERISLSPKEMDILITLAENRGQSFTQEQLYERVWGDLYGDLNTVSVHIQRLRRKLERDPSRPELILTEHGFGYRLCGEGEEP